MLIFSCLRKTNIFWHDLCVYAHGMNVGLYQSVSGMKSSFDQQQAIAENLANSALPGARARNVFFTVAEPADKSKLPEMVKSGAFSLPVEAQSYVSFRQGALQKTNSPYDIALESNRAFFAVRSADGQEMLTRNGQFNRNAAGHLVQTDGSELLLEGGGTLNLQGVNNILISDDGNVTSDAGKTLGKLKLVQVDNPQTDLTQMSSSMFKVKDDAKTKSGLAAGDRVAQGYLEQANSDTVEQMVKMISVMRVYEANQKMMTAQDDTMEKLITSITE